MPAQQQQQQQQVEGAGGAVRPFVWSVPLLSPCRPPLLQIQESSPSSYVGRWPWPAPPPLSGCCPGPLGRTPSGAPPGPLAAPRAQEGSLPPGSKAGGDGSGTARPPPAFGGDVPAAKPGSLGGSRRLVQRLRGRFFVFLSLRLSPPPPRPTFLRICELRYMHVQWGKV